jgi:uncharacterized protein YceK
MGRTASLLALSALLSGCGAVGTGAAGAAGAASAAQEAQQAKQTEDRVKQGVDAAYQKAAEQRNGADQADKQ